MPAPVLSADLDGCHVLALPAGTDIRALAVAWFVGGTWEAVPVTSELALGQDRRFRGSSPEPQTRRGRLRLTARAGLVGPWPLRAADARVQGLPDRDLDLYALDPHVTDPLVLGWMTAAARRAGGAVVSADRAQVIAPEAGASVDLTLWTGSALPASDLVTLVRPFLAGSRLGVLEQQPDGAYSVASAFEFDGAIRVSAERRNAVPVAVAAMQWGDQGPWTYTVSWVPPEPSELAAEQPSRPHVIARTRVAPVVARAARGLLQVAGGVVVDDGGFPVSDDELASRGTTL